MKKFYVTSEEDCARCEGNGFIENPQWTRFFAKHSNYGSLTPEEDEKALFEHFNIHSYKNLPPESEPCGDCEGEGKITNRVDLAEALAEGFGILRESVPTLQIQVSELRHKAGITEVDEEYERAMAD